jgi:hypothetical protein
VTIDLASSSIAGRVVAAASGVPVSGAYLALSGAGVLSFSGPAAHSDDRGAFTLPASPGTYELKVERYGFVPLTLPVTVGADGASTVEVVLEPASPP